MSKSRVMTVYTSARSLPLRVAHATRTVVIGRDGDGLLRVYIATAVGWRLRREPGRDDGELVVDPMLIAVLDAAAEGTDRTD